MKRTFRIALAGNPNAGKTTIFNHLTGAHQHVGNYPGVTVERKSGHCRLGELELEIIDLPGIYSLTSATAEERIAAEELQSGEIDLILDIVDSANLQRHLYLTTQLAELQLPLLLVFNMADDARKLGFKFNYDQLERFFGAPIVKTIGAQGIGIDRLKLTVSKMLRGELVLPPARFTYGVEADRMIQDLAEQLHTALPTLPITPRYYAIKLLEHDREIVARPEFAPLLPAAEEFRRQLTERLGVDMETFLADQRYGIISGACREAVKRTLNQRIQISDRLDSVLTSRYFGLPIFLMIMFLVFLFTFQCADPFIGLIEQLFESLANAIRAHWPESAAPIFRSLLVDGIIGGVGSVLVFLPNILFLFLAIAFLEGTGYMSRAAYVMDGVMHKFGLHGKSFIPMLLGFGCSVPAVMATRTIESERDRLTTIMVIPLMSCSARLPIYALIIPAFFVEKYQALVMWIIYLIGVVLALVLARLLKSTLFKGGDEVFVMELPPYRLPTFKSLCIHMWERTAMYLHKAGTLILAASIILFLISTYPIKTELATDYAGETQRIEQSTLAPEAKAEQLATLEAAQKAELLEYSVAGRIGRGLEIVLRPIGFDWRISSALIGAFAAKELFVSQLGILYSVGDADEESMPLRTALRENYTPLQGFCIMLFCLVTMPCLATVAVVRRETNSWKLTLLQALGLLVLAWLCAFVVYQLGSFLQLGTQLLGA